MAAKQMQTLQILAPAKINLYLHVTGRRDDGYHTLDSLIGFADIGDHIKIENADDFTFSVEGPFVGEFDAKSRDASPHSSNLAVQAAWALSRAAQKTPNVKITLTKNLPLAAGIGGGSADAAAVIWGLCEWWNISKSAPFLPGLMLELGADVPVCLHARPAQISGVGDEITPLEGMEEMPLILVNPGHPCPTASVFAHYSGPFRDSSALPARFEGSEDFVEFLKAQHNDLYPAAVSSVPESAAVIEALELQDDVMLARMSGSGATCFALFETTESAQKAADILRQENPDWWVQPGHLGRVERY